MVLGELNNVHVQIHPLARLSGMAVSQRLDSILEPVGEETAREVLAEVLA